MESMTVGEAAKAAGVSAKAIRLWESRGLIPQAERTIAGYRTFAPPDLARLRFICQAKALGLTLSEIKDILHVQTAGTNPCRRVVEAINDHLSAIDRSIADLLQLHEALTNARTVADTVCSDESEGVVCRIIEHSPFGAQ